MGEYKVWRSMMVMLTRALYFASGVIVLMTGIYVGMTFAEILSENVRFLIGLVSLTYFLVQFGRQILYPLREVGVETSYDPERQISS